MYSGEAMKKEPTLSELQDRVRADAARDLIVQKKMSEKDQKRWHKALVAIGKALTSAWTKWRTR